MLGGASRMDFSQEIENAGLAVPAMRRKEVAGFPGLARLILRQRLLKLRRSVLHIE